MASVITASCPKCNKSIKAPAEYEGKKIRCKGCSHAFVLTAQSAKPADSSKLFDDEDEGPPLYTLAEKETKRQCPQCSLILDPPDAVICLHCGFNLQTREKLSVRVTVETTTQDRIMWLLPGAVCAVLVVILIVLDVAYYLWEPKPHTYYAWLGHGSLKLWAIIISLFFMFFAGRFAIKRLIFDSEPPEKVKG
ncbi:MAG: hypothetical protein ACK4RK_19965 [Gemmataceae bacterium]